MIYFLAFLYILYTIYKIWLSNLELKFVAKKMDERAVVLSENDYKEAAKTKIINEKFEIFSTIYGLAIALFWILFFIKFLHQLIVTDGGILQNLIFVLAFFAINSLLELPLDSYKTLVQDRKLGFSVITTKTYILDKIKGFVLAAIFGSIIAWILLLCISYMGQFWWIWGFVASFVIMIFISFIYPTFIAPIFNKMSKLEDGEFKSSIEKLLSECGFKSSGVFVMNASKRDNRLNAYFGGLGSTKRVVLFDTLIQKLSPNEILAVLSHELGHFKHGDNVKMLALMFGILAIIFGIFGNLPSSVYESFGTYGSGIIIVFIALFSPILMAFLTPIVSKFSRKNEFCADNFAKNLQNKNDMISALVKLGSQNKAFPISHPIYSAVYHSHPTLYERIMELEK